MYNIKLYDLRFCDEHGAHVLTKHGEWKDYDPVGGPLADGTDAATDRIVQVVVPAPYELEGRTFPAKSFNLEQLLPGKAGEMFSFCGKG